MTAKHSTNDLARRIIRLKQERNLTFAQIAKATGVKSSTVEYMARSQPRADDPRATKVLTYLEGGNGTVPTSSDEPATERDARLKAEGKAELLAGMLRQRGVEIPMELR